jgi:hypothetical protein
VFGSPNVELGDSDCVRGDAEACYAPFHAPGGEFGVNRRGLTTHRYGETGCPARLDDVLDRTHNCVVALVKDAGDLLEVAANAQNELGEIIGADGNPIDPDLNDEILREYEERKSIESKIVKDADNLDIDIELKELEERGSLLPKKWVGFRRRVRNEKLYTKTAKKIWDLIAKSDPASWHMKANKWVKSPKAGL